MFKILIVSSSANANAATIALMNALPDSLFEKTVIAAGSINTANFENYDLAIFSAYRGDSNSAINAVKICLKNGLKVAQGVTSTSYNLTGSITYNLGITSGLEIDISDQTTEIKVLYDNNILKLSNGLSKNSSIPYRSAGSYFDYIDTIISSEFIKIASHPNDDNKVALGYLPRYAKTEKYDGFNAEFWYIGFAYANGSSATYIANFANIIQDICLFKSLTYKVSGFVTNSSGLPVKRLIRALDKTTGLLLKETTSNEENGFYEFLFSAEKELTIICYKESSSNNNSQIRDDVVALLDELE